MAHALIHILGSRSGYTTLDATPGVTAAERAELEVLSFGDATSSEAMARLEHSAVMTGRRLRSGRFAVSRMLPGGVDDAGRPTVEIITLLLDARAYTAAAGAFPRLADDARFWRVARGAVATGYELPEDRCVVAASDRGVLRAFDAWIAARKQGGVGVLPAADAGAVLAMVALLESVDQAQCRWGIGLLSLSAPVDLCTLAATASSSGPRPVVRASTGGAWHSPEMDHVSWHLEQRNPLLPRTDALVSAVRIEPALDEPASAAPFTRGAASAQRAPFAMQPRNLTKIAGISAACSLALLAVVTALYARGGRAANVVVPVVEGEKKPAVAEETTQPAEVAHGDYDQVQAEQKVVEPDAHTPSAPSPAAAAPATPPVTAAPGEPPHGEPPQGEPPQGEAPLAPAPVAPPSAPGSASPVPGDAAGTATSSAPLQTSVHTDTPEEIASKAAVAELNKAAKCIANATDQLALWQSMIGAADSNDNRALMSRAEELCRDEVRKALVSLTVARLQVAFGSSSFVTPTLSGDIKALVPTDQSEIDKQWRDLAQKMLALSRNASELSFKLAQPFESVKDQVLKRLESKGWAKPTKPSSPEERLATVVWNLIAKSTSELSHEVNRQIAPKAEEAKP